MSSIKLDTALLYRLCAEIAYEDVHTRASSSESHKGADLGIVKERACRLYRIARVEFLQLQEEVLLSMQTATSNDVRNRRLSEEIARMHPLKPTVSMEDGSSSQTSNDFPPTQEEDGESIVGLPWSLPNGPTEEAA